MEGFSRSFLKNPPLLGAAARAGRRDERGGGMSEAVGARQAGGRQDERGGWSEAGRQAAGAVVSTVRKKANLSTSACAAVP